MASTSPSYFVKLFANGDVRRFSFDSTSFDALKQKCIQIANIQQQPQQVILKYEDNENDKVTFNSDTELMYALKTNTSNLLKIHMLLVPHSIHNVDVSTTPAAVSINSLASSTDGSGDHYMKRHYHCHKLEKKMKELDARFISHQSCPDDTELPVGTPFEKTWRFRNTGSMTWPNGTMFLRVDGANDLSAPLTTLVASIAPEEETDVTVSMVVPSSAGRYQSYFKLCSPYGKKFGQRMRCQILAVDVKSISPEQMDKAWESLESMGFVPSGQRPNNISVLLMKYNCDVNKIVRYLVSSKT